VFRKNAAVMPLYQLVLLFVFFTGFAAILKVPGLDGAAADLSLLRLSKLAFGPWIVGLIGAAGLLTALVPGSMLLLTAGTILAKNVYRVAVPTASDATVAWLARALVPAIALVAVLFTLRGGQAIVPLLLLGYNLVTQLFPALMLSLPRTPLATRAGAVAGILTGEFIVIAFALSGTTPARVFPNAPAMLTDVNVGLVALVANTIAIVSVSAWTRGRTAVPREAAASLEPVVLRAPTGVSPGEHR